MIGLAVIAVLFILIILLFFLARTYCIGGRNHESCAIVGSEDYDLKIVSCGVRPTYCIVESMDCIALGTEPYPTQPHSLKGWVLPPLTHIVADQIIYKSWNNTILKLLQQTTSEEILSILLARALHHKSKVAIESILSHWPWTELVFTSLPTDCNLGLTFDKYEYHFKTQDVVAELCLGFIKCIQKNTLRKLRVVNVSDIWINSYIEYQLHKIKKVVCLFSKPCPGITYLLKVGRYGAVGPWRDIPVYNNFETDTRILITNTYGTAAPSELEINKGKTYRHRLKLTINSSGQFLKASVFAPELFTSVVDIRISKIDVTNQLQLLFNNLIRPIRRLALVDIQLSASDLNVLSNSVHTTSLLSLQLMPSETPDKSFLKVLINLVKNLTSIEVLDLRKCVLGGDLALSMFQSLLHCKNLSVLQIDLDTIDVKVLLAAGHLGLLSNLFFFLVNLPPSPRFKEVKRLLDHAFRQYRLKCGERYFRYPLCEVSAINILNLM